MNNAQFDSAIEHAISALNHARKADDPRMIMVYLRGAIQQILGAMREIL